MECSEPGIIRDEELIAYLAGEKVRPVVVQHLARCQRCSVQLATFRQMDRQFGRNLYRFDCPPSQILGEFHLGLLDATTEAHVQKHLSWCELCSTEVASLSSFLAQDPLLVSAPSVAIHSSVQNNHQSVQDAKHAWEQVREQAQRGVRRIIATLLPQQPRIAFARDMSQQTSLWPRRYIAEDVQVSMQLEQGSGRNGTFQLIGFVTRDGKPLEELRGVSVQLSSATQTVFTQQIDDLGNFLFAPLAPATYVLELQFPDETIVIDQLEVSSPE